MIAGKTVIIGGGAIGLSVAYHLGKLRVPDVVLLERNQLTSGTSWHAAGIVGPLRSSKNLTELTRYAVELFSELEQETGQTTGYRQTGGLWLAQSEQRMIELRRIAAMGRMHHLDAEVLNPGQTRSRFEHLNVHDLAGSIWVQQDGQVNPVDLCMAYAKGARQCGVEIRENAGVKDIEVSNGIAHRVILDNGEELNAHCVINCAGLWAREIGLMASVQVPLRAVEHIYIVTEPLDKLDNPCPIIRDLDNGIYIKGDAGRLVLGTFEKNAKLWDPNTVHKNASYLEFAEDWDHIEPMLHAGIHRIPAFADMGITGFMNGPESFTPDTKQLMGRAQGMKNFYVAAGFNSIGIMSSAGVGKVMAQWVSQHQPPMDLWEVDIQRFDARDNAEDFLDQRIPESVHNQFQMHWPLKQYNTGRDRKRSPWHELLADHGAVFGAPTGWERPLWYAQSDKEKVFDYSHQAQWWWPYAQRESKQLMTTGAIFDLSPFSKFRIFGGSAGAALQGLCTNNINRGAGNIAYSLMLNRRGGIEAECTVTQSGDSEFLVVTGAATRIKDYHWFVDNIGSAAQIVDITEEFSVIGLMGPNAALLLESISDQSYSISTFPFATSQMITIENTDVRANRISFVGEKGWELFIPIENAAQIMQLIITQGKKFEMGLAGHLCLECCRLEKGYLHWGHEVGPDDFPHEAGLMFAVRMKAEFDFIGKQALWEKMQNPIENGLRLFSIDGAKPLLLHDEPVFCNGSWVGRTTSGGLGFRTDMALTMAALKLEKFLEHGKHEIEVAGERFPLTLLRQPPYDPDGNKMRRD